MKKIIKSVTALIISAILISSQALAASIDINSIDIKGSMVTVSGKSQKTDEYVTMVVIKKDGDSKNAEDILTIAQKKSDTEGKFQIDFDIPETLNGVSTDGEYKIIMHTNKSAENKTVSDFIYISEKTRDDILNIIKTNSPDKISEALFLNEYYIKGLGVEGVNTNKLSALSDKSRDSVFATLLDGKNVEEIILSDIVQELNTHIVFYEMNEGRNILDNITEINPVFEEKPFNELIDDEKEFLTEMVEKNIPFENKADFEKKYPEFSILCKINNARYSQIDGIMKDYIEEIGIKDNSAYKKFLGFSSSNKQKVQEKIVSELENNKVYNIADFVDILEDAVSDIKTKPSTGGGGGGSGSSGGSVISGQVPNASKNTYVENITPNGVTAVEADIKERITFEDIDDAKWAEEAIIGLAEKGIINGIGKGLFAPNQVITREAFVKIVVEAAGLYNPGAKSDFSDVVDGAWYESYVASAVDAGLVAGQSEDIFGVGKPITRQDVCVIAAKLLKNTNTDVELIFADSEDISDYAKESVKKLVNLGVISGMGNNEFKPKNTCTRAQAAKIVWGILNKEV